MAFEQRSERKSQLVGIWGRSISGMGEIARAKALGWEQAWRG